MDHHCTVSNNCVGKKNMRFFIQFTAWASFTLIVSIITLLILFKTQNVQRGVGIKKLSDVVIINPITAYKRVIGIIGGIF